MIIGQTAKSADAAALNGSFVLRRTGQLKKALRKQRFFYFMILSIKVRTSAIFFSESSPVSDCLTQCSMWA